VSAAKGVVARVASLHVYPVKACRGIAVDAWPLERRGLRHDRHLVLVDPSGRFVTQREEPRLAWIETALPGGEDPAGLVTLTAPGAGQIAVPLRSGAGEPIAVRVWDDEVAGLAVDPKADAWLSALLDRPLRLAAFPEGGRRAVDPAYAPGHETAFADGFPLLVVGEGSLAELNRRLDAPVPMDRFRPNVVVGSAAPFAEDGWDDVVIGAVAVRMVKPCARCVVTTTDQQTGERSAEPLRTLAGFRREDGGVMFGQNAVVLRTGRVRVGDSAVALRSRATGP
jgi:uncharacterized protein